MHVFLIFRKSYFVSDHYLSYWYLIAMLILFQGF